MAALWRTLGTFWGLLGCLWESLGDPWGARGASWGHIWDQVLKEDFPNSRKSVASAPPTVARRAQEAPRWPRKGGQESLNEALKANKTRKKTSQNENDENLNFDDPLERNAGFWCIEINEIWSFFAKKRPKVRWNNEDDVKTEFRRAKQRSKTVLEAHFETQKPHGWHRPSDESSSFWASGAP